MKKVKLLSISIFLLLQSCITNNKNTTESNTVQSLEDSILIADSLKSVEHIETKASDITFGDIINIKLNSIKTKKDATDYNSKDSISLSGIEKAILNRKLLKIVKQDNEFKYSCADEAYIEYRYLLLTKDSLFIVEMEPMEFAVKTTFSKDKALVVENPQKVRYKVQLVDKNKEITYWKMDNGSGGVVDEYCFYAIPVDNLKKFKLKKEICRD